MNNSSFFNSRRFAILLRNDLLLNSKSYLIAAAAAFLLIGFVTFLFMSNLSDRTSFGAQGYLYAFMMCMIGFGAFVGSSFAAVGNKRSLSVYLLTPASVFEKYLVQFVVRFLLGILAFWLIFSIDALIVRSIVLQSNAHKGIYNDIAYFSVTDLFLLTDRVFDRLWFVLMLLTIATYLFSVRLFFGKSGLIKTVATIPVPVLTIVVYMVVLSHIFSPSTTGFDINVFDYPIADTHTNVTLWIFSLFAVSWLFLLPLGYFKLKEKQV